RDPRERTPAAVGGPAPELIFDPQQLVVLRRSVRTGRRTRLDLAAVRGDGDVGDRRVLGLAGPVGDDGRIPVPVGELDRVERLAECSDLVDLDEDRVR